MVNSGDLRGFFARIGSVTDDGAYRDRTGDLRLAKLNQGFRSVPIRFRRLRGKKLIHAGLRPLPGGGAGNAPRDVCDRFVSRTLAAAVVNDDDSCSNLAGVKSQDVV